MRWLRIIICLRVAVPSAVDAGVLAKKVPTTESRAVSLGVRVIYLENWGDSTIRYVELAPSSYGGWGCLGAIIDNLIPCDRIPNFYVKPGETVRLLFEFPDSDSSPV